PEPLAGGTGRGCKHHGGPLLMVGRTGGANRGEPSWCVARRGGGGGMVGLLGGWGPDCLGEIAPRGLVVVGGKHRLQFARGWTIDPHRCIAPIARPLEFPLVLFPHVQTTGDGPLAVDYQ